MVGAGNGISKMLSSSSCLSSFASQGDLILLQKLLRGKVYMICFHVYSTGVRTGVVLHLCSLLCGYDDDDTSLKILNVSSSEKWSKVSRLCFCSTVTPLRSATSKTKTYMLHTAIFQMKEISLLPILCKMQFGIYRLLM